MATDPIKLIRRHRIKHAAEPAGPADQSEPTLQVGPPAPRNLGPEPPPDAPASGAAPPTGVRGFMDAVVPPALALGATGILIGTLFDRKHGLFAGTTAALGLLGTAIGAGWGALQAGGGTGGTGGLSDVMIRGIGRMFGFGDQSGEPSQGWGESLAPWVRWLSPVGGGGVGFFLGSGLGSRLYKRFAYPRGLKKFNLYIPHPTHVRRFDSFIDMVIDTLQSRGAVLKPAIDRLNNKASLLVDQAKQLDQLLRARIQTKMKGMSDLAYRVTSQKEPLYEHAISQKTVVRQQPVFESPVLITNNATLVSDALAANKEVRLRMATREFLSCLGPGDINPLEFEKCKDVLKAIAKDHGLERSEKRIFDSASDQIAAARRSWFRNRTDAEALEHAKQSIDVGRAERTAQKRLSKALRALEQQLDATARDISVLERCKRRLPNIKSPPKWPGWTGGLGVGAAGVVLGEFAGPLVADWLMPPHPVRSLQQPID